ncbi:MAG: SH3 domain-containing protein, partial [Clostridia bacterium]|nr:SH3 domain-containing protein [Clostridia bacterium]
LDMKKAMAEAGEDPGQTGEEIEDDEEQGLRAITVKDNVNLRAKPQKKSKRVALLKRGTELTLYEKTVGKKYTWYRTVYEGKEAYVRADMVMFEATTNNLIIPQVCTCGTETDVHAQDCPLYVAAPECTCGAEADENGNIVHAQDCLLYVAVPECTCGAEADENGNIVHSQDCPLYVAPECTCGAEADENGNITHAEDCPLYVAPLSDAAAAFIAAVDALPVEDMLAAVQAYVDATGTVADYEANTPEVEWDEDAYLSLTGAAEDAYMRMQDATLPAMAAMEMYEALSEDDMADGRVAQAFQRLNAFFVQMRTLMGIMTRDNTVPETLDGDWMYLSKFEVNNDEIQDGTEPFDTSEVTTDEDYRFRDGNDGNDSNKIVRSFDVINYPLDYATTPTDVSTVTYVKAGWLNYEFVLPATSDKAVFLPDSMSWVGTDMKDATGLSGLQVQTSGYYITTEEIEGAMCQVMRGKYWVAPNLTNQSAMPGEGTLKVAVQVKAMKKGEIVQPTFKGWMENNHTDGECPTHGFDEVKSFTPEIVTVTSQVRMNVEIVEKTQNESTTFHTFDFSQGNGALNMDADPNTVVGKQLRYGIMVQLRNANSSDGMKGMEIPDGDTLTFDINLGATYTPLKGSEYDINGTVYAPLAWALGENENVQDTWHGRSPLASTSISGAIEYRTNVAPTNRTGTIEGGDRSCLNGGDWSVSQTGKSTYTVTVSGIEIDLDQIPNSNIDSSTGGEYEKKGIAVISAGQLVVVQPVIVNNVNIINAGMGTATNGAIVTIVSDSNLSFTYKDASGEQQTLSNDDQTVKTDDRSGNTTTVGSSRGTFEPTCVWTSAPIENYVGWNKGIYDTSGTSTGFLNKGGDATTAGHTIGLLLGMDHNNTADSDGGEIVAAKLLGKFDATAVTPTGNVTYRDTSTSTFEGAAAGFEYKVLYATKPNGENWTDDDEMKSAKMTDLVYYESMDKIPSGHVCVAVLVEALPEDGDTSKINGSRQLPGANIEMKVKEDVEGYELYMCTPHIISWNKSNYDVVGGNIPSLINTPISLPTAESNWNPDEFQKGSIDSDGVFSGTVGTYQYGDSFYVMEAKSTIKKEVVQQENGNSKSTFDLDSDQRVVDYKLSVTTGSVYSGDDMTGVYTDVEVYDILPKGLTYIPGSMYYGGTYTQNPTPGRQGTITGGEQITPESVTLKEDGTTEIKYTIRNVEVN